MHLKAAQKTWSEQASPLFHLERLWLFAGDDVSDDRTYPLWRKCARRDWAGVGPHGGEKMIGLLEDRLVPLTNTFGFLPCPVDVATSAFLDWQRPIQDGRGVALEARAVHGSLEALLRTLLPLTSVERRRFLFMATRSEWTAFVDNGHQGTDAFPPVSYLAQAIGCRGVRATDAASGRTQGGTIFELYGPQDTGWLNIERSISAIRTDGRWAFSASGTALVFEKPEFYARRRIKDRFDTGVLKTYLAALGIDAFDPAFYADEGRLIEKVGATAPGMQLFGVAG